MDNLLVQIQQGEGINTEFKISFQKEVIESVVAFANAKGGKIFIGISDSAKIIGITVSAESIQNYINSIKQNTQPNIIVDINEFILEEKTILVIEVQEQPIKPIAYKNRYFKRINNSNHLMSLNEIANEHLKTVNESWDCHIDTRHDFDDISIDKAIKLIDAPGPSDIKYRPVVDKGLCVGCGLCQKVCPARPVRAIIVNPSTAERT